MTDDEMLSLWAGEHVRGTLRRRGDGSFQIGVIRGRPGEHIGMSIGYTPGFAPVDDFIATTSAMADKMPKRWGPLRLAGFDERPIGPI